MKVSMWGKNTILSVLENTSSGNVQGKNFGGRFVWDFWHTPSFCGIFPEFLKYVNKI